MGLGVEDVDWLVISLRRTPERLAAFSAINGHLGLPIETMEAVDGQTLDRGDLDRDGIIAADSPWGAGTIGASLSHRKCWEHAVETGRPVGIFEDDIYLRHDFVDRAQQAFAALPADWDLVHFGFNTDSVLNVEMLPDCLLEGRFSVDYPSHGDCLRFTRGTGHVALAKLHNLFGRCAYAVSPKGAQRLIEGCFPLNMRAVGVPGLPTGLLFPHSGDGVMNGLYREMSAYVCLPPIAMPANDKAASTVNSP
jgi:GR25 family glycosyltransferase involved in LPS biosynthesis